MLIKVNELGIKKWIILFGILDIFKIKNVIDFIMKIVKGEIHYINVLGLIFYILVVITGIYLIRLKKIGFILSYIEFPIRLVFMYPSFSFLLYLNKIIENQVAVVIILGLLEILRLLITINIHRKIFKKTILKKEKNLK